MDRDIEANNFNPERGFNRRFFGPYARAAYQTGRLISRVARRFHPYNPVGAALAANIVQRGRSRARLPSPPTTPKKMSRSRSRGRTMRRRTSRSRSRSSRSTSSSGSALTNQRDQRTSYRSGGRRRRGSGFIRRVQWAIASNQAPRVLTLKKSVNLNCALNKTTAYGVGLYTTAQNDQPDLTTIFTDAGFPVATAINAGCRLVIKSAVLTCEMKNTGSVQLVVDLYTLLNKKDVAQTADMFTQFQTMFVKQETITSASFEDAAVSVFENPVFCQHYKILQKREILIDPGEIATVAMKVSKDRIISAQTVNDYVGSVPKVGKFYFIHFHGAPDPTADAGAPGLAAGTLTVSWQKVYRYCLLPNTKLLPGTHQA